VEVHFVTVKVCVVGVAVDLKPHMVFQSWSHPQIQQGWGFILQTWRFILQKMRICPPKMGV
jgi:hypothetical protein